MKLHYRGKPLPMASLRKELDEAGAEFLEPTNEWEALRYRYGGGGASRGQCPSGSLKTKSAQTREALLHIHKIARGRFTVFAEWVKGHQPAKAAASDPRVGFNRRCDALAKDHWQSLDTERMAAGRAQREGPGLP